MIQLMFVNLVGGEASYPPLDGVDVATGTKDCIAWVRGVIVVESKGACKHARVV